MPASIQRTICRLSLLLLPLLVAGCATALRTKAFPTEGVSFQEFRTYHWFAEPKTAAPESEFEDKLSINPLLQDLIETELASRGWRKAPASEADLTIGFLILLQDDTAMTVVDKYFGHAIDEPAVRLIHEAGIGDRRVEESGAVVFDVVENPSNNLVWRGWVETEVDRTRSESDRERRIRAAISKLMARFPRAGG